MLRSPLLVRTPASGDAAGASLLTSPSPEAKARAESLDPGHEFRLVGDVGTRALGSPGPAASHGTLLASWGPWYRRHQAAGVAPGARPVQARSKALTLRRVRNITLTAAGAATRTHA